MRLLSEVDILMRILYKSELKRVAGKLAFGEGQQ
jgi:hypothetical protein